MKFGILKVLFFVFFMSEFLQGQSLINDEILQKLKLFKADSSYFMQARIIL